jgi:hypothetical protein
MGTFDGCLVLAVVLLWDWRPDLQGLGLALEPVNDLT